MVGRYADGGLYLYGQLRLCLLYTSDAADDLLCVDLGGRRIIKKKKKKYNKLTKQKQFIHIINSLTKYQTKNNHPYL